MHEGYIWILAILASIPVGNFFYKVLMAFFAAKQEAIEQNKRIEYLSLILSIVAIILSVVSLIYTAITK